MKNKITSPRSLLEARFKDQPVQICGGCDKRSNDPKFRGDIWNFYNTFTFKWVNFGDTHEGHKMVTGVLECNDCGWYDGKGVEK